MLLKILPLSFSKLFSCLTFRILGRLSSADKTAIKNCKFVFPNFSDYKIRNIVDKSWENIGKTICELLKLEQILNKDNIFIKGLDNIKKLNKSL